MTERSRFWTTNNTGDGPTIGYSTSDWEKILRHWFQAGDEANGGVLFGIGNLLACSGTATPIALNTGAAMVYGHYYENDASLNLAVTSPVVGTTGGRVVLRVNNAAQTVRAFAVKNTDGIATPPALTQSAGTTWEISLYTFTITTGGVIALTDTRKYAKFSTKIYGDQLDTSVADNSTLEYAAGAIRVKDSGITTAKLNDLAVTNAKLGANSVSASKIQDGEVSGIKLAANSVDDTKAGNRIARFYRRQGGNAAAYGVAGTNNYDMTGDNLRVQFGAGTSDGSGNISVTFPVAYAGTCVIFLAGFDCQAIQDAVTLTGFTGKTYTAAGVAVASKAYRWLAIGPA